MLQRAAECKLPNDADAPRFRNAILKALMSASDKLPVGLLKSKDINALSRSKAKLAIVAAIEAQLRQMREIAQKHEASG